MSAARALGVVVVTVAAAGPAAAELPAFCDEARALLAGAPAAGDEAWPRYLAVAEKLPRESDAVIEDARRRAGESGTLAATFAALAAALDDGCRAPVLIQSPAAAAAEVRALLEADERFAGEREELGLIDEWKARFAAWLEELFESELMRRYAGASRAVYLTALALFVLFVALRFWRARVRGRAREDAAADEARVERERQRAFSEWLHEARAAFDEGDLRGALRAGQLALLARIGEVEEGAVTPARTNREVLRRLDEATRDVVAPCLSSFERAFYGGLALEPAGVAAFLDDVARAAASLRTTS